MLNLSIGLAGLVLCGLSILLVLSGAKVNRTMERRSLLFYICLSLFAGANLAGQLMRGHPGAAFRAGIYLSNFLEFTLSCLLLRILVQQLLFITDPEGKRKVARRALRDLMLAHIALLIVSQFTGLYYIIDELNIYRRGAGYPLSYVFPAAMIVVYLYLLIRGWDRLTGNERAAFGIYAALAITAMVLQIFIYGIYFVVFATIIGALVMYLLMVREQTERYYREETENIQLRVDIMLSQIQPHFLYNVLAVIQDLCHSGDLEQAEAATIKFSRYLRGNMDALRMEDPVPFERELKHTRCYLELERMRFEESLEVQYDIQDTAFDLPTLTLQPIVENAVRHGVRGNPDGVGVVTIATRERPDCHEISVRDNGPGFDPSALPEDTERPHIGIQNVRSRLARLCGGTLKIVSTIGYGTTVTIRLPKRKN